jgi:hypothetical protein
VVSNNISNIMACDFTTKSGGIWDLQRRELRDLQGREARLREDIEKA